MEKYYVHGWADGTPFAIEVWADGPGAAEDIAAALFGGTAVRLTIDRATLQSPYDED